MAISTRFFLLLSFLCCLSQTACAVTETVRMDSCHESDPMYLNGSHFVTTVPVEQGGALCCSLRVTIPKRAGLYPVVQFQHGFELQNSDYTALITQVASWGFIVVAPQMYGLLPTGVTTEITNARSILNWMKTGLPASLKHKFPKHCPDFNKVALAGHSRGGMVVFGLARNYGSASKPYSAVVGLDPVDTWPCPTVLKHKENSVDVGVPTLIVGTGLGPQCPPCAPEYQGHIHFYRDLSPASFHFNATENGHMDFTDDCGGGEKLPAVPPLRCWGLCKPGPSRQCMRQFAAGIMVAFLQGVLLHNSSSFWAALTQAAKAPVALSFPEWKGNISSPYEAHQYADI